MRLRSNRSIEDEAVMKVGEVFPSSQAGLGINSHKVKAHFFTVFHQTRPLERSSNLQILI